MKKTVLILALAGVLSCQSSEELVELRQKVETDKKVSISKIRTVLISSIL